MPGHSEGLFTVLTPDGDRRSVNYDSQRYPEAYERGAKNVAGYFQQMIAHPNVRIAVAWGTSDKNIAGREPFEINAINTAVIAFIRQILAQKNTTYSGTKWVHLGNKTLLSPELNSVLDELSDATRSGVEKVCGLCLGYGSDDEIDRAIMLATEKGDKPINFRQYLDLPYRAGIQYQKADLLLRTGLENPSAPYTSGCMLPYQGSKTRAHHFTELMPEIDPALFSNAVDEYLKNVIRDGA